MRQACTSSIHDGKDRSLSRRLQDQAPIDCSILTVKMYPTRGIYKICDVSTLEKTCFLPVVHLRVMKIFFLSGSIWRLLCHMTRNIIFEYNAEAAATPDLYKSTSCYTHLCRHDDNHVFPRLVRLDLIGFYLARSACPFVGLSTTPDVVVLRVVFDYLL